MARKQARPEASQTVVLEPVQLTCRACGNRMRMARHSQRTITTLQGVTHLTLKVYRCRNADCSRNHQAIRLGSKRVDGHYHMANLGWM
jgi:hypothetical protein